MKGMHLCRNHGWGVAIRVAASKLQAWEKSRNATYCVQAEAWERLGGFEAAEAFERAGRPVIHAIASELEALRIDIRQGKVAAAQPEIEDRLAKVETWWKRQRAGQPVPEAPDAEVLARAYLCGLDIARSADFARKNWESALRRLDTMLEVERELERAAVDIGRTRFNRAVVLLNLERFGEAKAELEACLQIFQNDPAGSANVLSSLAELFGRQGDPAQAIAQERRALALRSQLPAPADRGISHHNMANHLDNMANHLDDLGGAPSDLAESPRHLLAAFIYFLAAGMGQHLLTCLSSYAIRFRRAQAAGTELAVPRVPQLLADPAFAPLKQWLRQREADVDELQSAVDQYLEQSRQAAAQAPSNDQATPETPL